METKKINLGNFTAKIIQDEDNQGPREWDNLGTMVCEHRRYSLGDSNHGVDLSSSNSWDDHEKAIKKVFGKDCVLLPIYMIDHSGQSVSTSPFSCPWDSGRVGSIVASRKDIRENFGIKRVTKEKLDHSIQILKGEVETYDQYLQGDVYGYQIVENMVDDEGNEYEADRDSCWGFYGLEIIEEEVNQLLKGYKEEQDKVMEDENQKPKCDHLFGLANLEEEDEFVMVHAEDAIDFEAGNNTKFQFCPMCGEKL